MIQVRYPCPIDSTLNEDFAEFMGILIGDGHLDLRKKSTYYFKITGNPKKELNYYEYVSTLVSKIIQRPIKPRTMDTGRSIGVTFCSKDLGELVFSLGFPKSSKCYTVTIPEKIFLNAELATYCLRGIFDTDGCLTIKRRYRQKPYYPTINFVSASRKLIIQTSALLNRLGIEHCMVLDKAYYDTRTLKYYTKNFIHIYGFKRVAKWFDVVGTSNPDTLQKYLCLINGAG